MGNLEIIWHETLWFCRLPDVVRALKSRKVQWDGHVTRMEKTRNAYRILDYKSVDK
jgi:hypothetical protein